MSGLSEFTDKNLLQRDGVSQADRLQAALDPSYVAVDERSFKDLLTFAQAYAKRLRFFDVRDQRVQAVGNWSAFLPESDDLDEVVAFMQQPDRVSPEQARRYSRPHFALFLTFLHLLRHTQTQMNSFTRSHLDFYYGEVLRLTKRAGTPDKVNVLVDLAPETTQLPLPAGTLFHAGSDSQGQNLVYRTDQDIVINRAQVAKLSAMYAQKEVTGLREAGKSGSVPMLQITLGDSSASDRLPDFSESLLKLVGVDTKELEKIRKLQDFVNFVIGGTEKISDETEKEVNRPFGFYMTFVDLRVLMLLKDRRQKGNEWEAINRLLEQNGGKREGFSIDKASRDFDTKFQRALGVPTRFKGNPTLTTFPNVDDIYDLYKLPRQKLEEDFITNRLNFLNVEDFYTIVQIKMQIDNDWNEIFRILAEAGRRRETLAVDFPITDPNEPDLFQKNFEAAFKPDILTRFVSSGITTLDGYYSLFQDIEKYFHMSAENFSTLMVLMDKGNQTDQEWETVYQILSDAHKEKVYDDRKQKLINQLGNPPTFQNFEAMLNEAVRGGEGAVEAIAPLKPEQHSDDQNALEISALQRLEQLISPDDFALLTSFSERVGKKPEPSEDKGKEVCRIAELAQRRLLPEPVAQKEEWLNLYPTEDVTAFRQQLGGAANADIYGWKTFGQRSPQPNDHTSHPSFGWAISSSLLSLSQGARTITLTLDFSTEGFNQDTLTPYLEKNENVPFLIEISTAKRWIQADKITAKMVSYPDEQTLSAIQFTLTFGKNVEALAAPPIELSGIDTRWPILRLRLRPLQQAGTTDSTPINMTHYQLFRTLRLQKIHLKVTVDGLIPLLLQNDESVLDATKPFEPFGPNAIAGSRLYMGHPELVYNQLDKLNFTIEWKGVPNNLKAHYTNYDRQETDNNDKIILNPIIQSNASFQIAIRLIDTKREGLLLRDAKLFNDLNAGEAQTVPIEKVEPKSEGSSSTAYPYHRMTDADVVTGDDLFSWPRYLQWELQSPDFQHQNYPALAAQRSMALAVAIANQQTPIDAAIYHLNPPYTPVIKRLTLGYEASSEITLGANQSQFDRLFHLYPFGFIELKPEDVLPTFLPQFDYEGELYIGLRDLTPPQTVLLLFQMAEGSAANLDRPPAAVAWSYLSDNRWLTLGEGSLIQDGTDGLIHSGIVSLALEPARANTLLPSDLYWLRVAIPRYVDGVSDTIGIHAQVVPATFVDQGNAPDHLNQPLPPTSISELVDRLAGVAGVRQPYASYGGKMAEQDSRFYTRISERLRHKQRALTLWDYEHLILERFPEVYKAKCLPASSSAPGQVKVIIIPDIKNKVPFNPFEPKAPASLLADIQDYLAALAPPFATIQVKNATYQAVRVRFAVRFLSGYDKGYYTQRLNEELNRFLSPWAYQEGADIVIGGRIYANVIVNFIEQRPYVDYVAHLKLFLVGQPDTRTGPFEKYVAADEADDVVFVGDRKDDVVLVGDRKHVIDLIPDTGYVVPVFRGIGYMKIGLDFIVH